MAEPRARLRFGSLPIFWQTLSESASAGTVPPALVDATVHVDPCRCDLCGDPHPSAHHAQAAMGS